MKKTINYKPQTPQTNIIIAATVAVAVAVVGYSLFSSRAGGPYATLEPETATLSGGAKIIDDSAASNGRALQFAVPPANGGGSGGGGGSTVVNLDDPAKKEIAMQLVSSAENSSLDWRAQYKYLEDIGDGRGYTGGIIGFCSGCYDMYELVAYYNTLAPNNVLKKYTNTLKSLGESGSSSHSGLDPNFTKDWAAAANDPMFKKAQEDERDRVYFNPALKLAKADGVRALGQFMYYDALVMHGEQDDSKTPGLLTIIANAKKKAKTPAQGGDEKTYLNAFLDARKAAMQAEAAHEDTTRVDTMQRKFLTENKLNLETPLSWSVYGDPFTIK